MNAWTLDEALHALKLNPRDTYLQYVVLQLARREGKLDQVAGEVEKLAFGGDTDGRAARRAQVDLFGMFAGALAVQEGLQLDTMRGRSAVQAPAAPAGVAMVITTPELKQIPTTTSGSSLSGPSAAPVAGPTSPEPVSAPAPADSGEPPPMPPADPIEGTNQAEAKPATEPPHTAQPRPSEQRTGRLRIIQRALKQAPTGPVCRVVARWETRLVETPDVVNGGVPLRGLAGRVYLLGPDLPSGEVSPSVSGDGEVIVDLYDDRPRAVGGEPVALERWQFPPDVLTKLLRKDIFGWGYTLFLPWGKTYRPDITQVHLRVRYVPPGAAPLYFVSSTINLTPPEAVLAQASGPNSTRADSELYQATTITGYVFNDETSEPMIACVRCVCLDETEGPHSLTATTDSDGTFVIAGLQAGKRYRLTAKASENGRTLVGTHRLIAPNICATIRLTERHRNAEPRSVAPTSEAAPSTPKEPESGLTLPTGRYLEHPPQYIPPTPEYPLPRELENLQDASARPGSGKPDEESKPAPADQWSTKAPAPEPASEAAKQASEDAKWEKIAGPSMRVSQLHGPTVKSHPWRKMLAGRDPKVSRLSRCVPHDFYLVEFRSVSKLLEVIDSADQWSTFIYSQSVKDARSQRVAERLKKQFVLDAEDLDSFVYDRCLAGIAITGSDLFIREGSDVTLLLEIRQGIFGKQSIEQLWKRGMDLLLAKAAKSRPDATRTTGKMLGVDYVHLETPDRSVCVYAAYPEPFLHVRTNSEVALRRVLEAIRGKDAHGNPVKRLGETDEFKYIRTLMPHGAKEEDGFVYLSDAFIRHMVSPRLKLTELRRLTAYNHLRMIGHAAQLYRTEQGQAPASLEALAEADCCPGKFNEGDLKAPDGGTYTLSADGTGGVCTRHGTVRFLTPCCEIPVARVSWDEAAAYKAFVDQYNEYWRTYFDPIAIRVQVQPKRVRMETIVLPLIDNTVYTMLAKVLGGAPEHLDSLPVPKRNLFSLSVRLNKEELVKGLMKELLQGPLTQLNDGKELKGPLYDGQEVKDAYLLSGMWAVAGELADKYADSPETKLLLGLPKFLMKGLGNQVGLHVYDQGVPFDLNLATFLGQMVGSFNGNGTRTSDTSEVAANLGAMMYAIPVAALTAPGYISFTVQDEKIVDDFLAQLDKVIPSLASDLEGKTGSAIEGDYYKLTLKGGITARSFAVRFGPARFRVHCARIGKGLYITNHAGVLEDIQAAAEVQAKAGATADLGPKGHAMVRMRPRNWDQALPGFRLSWAENNRQTCLGNQGPLSGIARALTAVPPGAEAAKTASWDDRRMHDYAARVYGTYHACPDGGRYVLSADGKTVTCTVHGSPQNPRQGMAPADGSPTARLMRDFADLTAALTFTPEGLRAVLTIERK
jgi:hypothetical protein